MTKSKKQLDREIDDFLATADAWSVAADALMEHLAPSAAAIVRSIRKDHGIQGAPPVFMDAVRDVPSRVREDLISRLGPWPPKTIIGHRGRENSQWLDETMLRFPLGLKVRVARSDFPEYVGSTGRVVGYYGSWPYVEIKFDKPYPARPRSVPAGKTLPTTSPDGSKAKFEVGTSYPNEIEAD